MDINIVLNVNDRIDDLEIDGYKLIQNTSAFCFGIDSVVLSDFAAVKDGGYCLDLCAGNGVIPILMYAKGKSKSFDLVEIQPTAIDLINRNISLNKLENNLKLVGDDLTNYKEFLKPNYYDTITVNPPYMKKNSGLEAENEMINIARCEIKCTLTDIAKCANYALKDKGHIYMIHRPYRLEEIINVFNNNNLNLKSIQMVHSKMDKEATMVLIDAVKNSNSYVKVLKPLIIYNEDDSYTDEVLKIYG